MEPRTYGQRPGPKNSLDVTEWPGSSVEDSLQKGDPMRPPSTSERHQNVTQPLQLIKKMCTRFPWRNMSWIVGTTFTIGSAFFVVNGFFLLLPLTNPSTFFDSQLYWTGATGLIGGVIFIVGGFAGVLEALNVNRGPQVTMIEGIIADGDTPDMEFKSDEEALSQSIHQSNKSVAPCTDSTMDFPLRQPLPSTHSQASTAANHDSNPTTATLPALYGSPAFIFWPNTPQLRTIFFHDLCFIAAVIQSIGTFIFMLATITAFPGVIDLTNVTLYYLANLFPATLGGVLFVTASAMQTITTQPNWYTPRPLSVEWHVGFWNVIGSIGFTLAGAFFFLGTTAGSIQASGSSLWGSVAFMLGGMLQWYVSMKCL